MAEKIFTGEEISIKLKCYIIENFRTIKKASEKYGYKPKTISAMCTGRRTPHKIMLSDMGYEKVTAYRKVKKND